MTSSLNAGADDALPYLITAQTLAARLPANDNLAVVCLGNRDRYLDAHLPGASYLDPKRLNAGVRPVAGLLPEAGAVEHTFREAGLNPSSHVVCYDDDGGTAAARMMWVLEAMGHQRQSFLDGGFHAWQSAGYPVEGGDVTRPVGMWEAHPNPAVVIDKAEILALVEAGKIEDRSVHILDARSAEEHQGQKSASERRGRIPGAVNLEWLTTIADDHTLKPTASLLASLADLGITPDSDVIVHCQTHQRSSHSFMMLRSLGFRKIRGYPGSWSEWAADPHTPAETGPPRIPG